MKILVVSDTHRNFSALKKVLDREPDFDTLIHLGDGEKEFFDIQTLYPDKAMIYVRGNCDYGQHEQVHVAKFGDVRIFCCHGNDFGVKYGRELLAATASRNNCNIALYGHTHLYKTEVIDGVLVLNPGSPSEPRGGNPPTFAVLEIGETGEIKTNFVEL